MAPQTVAKRDQVTGGGREHGDRRKYESISKPLNLDQVTTGML